MGDLIPMLRQLDTSIILDGSWMAQIVKIERHHIAVINEARTQIGYVTSFRRSVDLGLSLAFYCLTAKNYTESLYVDVTDGAGTFKVRGLTILQRPDDVFPVLREKRAQTLGRILQEMKP